MKRFHFLVCIAALLCGCATAGKMTKIQLGMTRDQVISAIGKPASVSAQGNREYLNYSLSETDNDQFVNNTRPYYVRLIDGRVESFGRAGDFNSTKDTTVQIKTEAVNATPADNYDRLIKLNELRKSGAITEEEYQREKSRLIQ